jgi:hypothetical protein
MKGARRVLVLVHQLAERPAPYLEKLRQGGFEIVHSGLQRAPDADELSGLACSR